MMRQLVYLRAKLFQKVSKKREIIKSLNWSTYNYGTSQLLVWRNAFSSIVEEWPLLFGFGKVTSWVDTCKTFMNTKQVRNTKDMMDHYCLAKQQISYTQLALFFCFAFLVLWICSFERLSYLMAALAGLFLVFSLLPWNIASSFYAWEEYP